MTVQGSCTTDTTGSGAPLSFSASELQGNWTLPCLPAVPTGPYPYNSIIEALTISGSTVTVTDFLYSDTACGSIYYTLQEVGTFVMGESSFPSDPLATTFDYSPTFVQLTPNTAEAATAMNVNSMCSLSGWTNGIEQTVTGKTCAGEPMPNAEVTQYGLVETDGGTSLSFGGPWGSSPADRPTSVSGMSYDKE